jgi:hypothetical protein
VEEIRKRSRRLQSAHSTLIMLFFIPSGRARNFRELSPARVGEYTEEIAANYTKPSKKFKANKCPMPLYRTHCQALVRGYLMRGSSSPSLRITTLLWSRVGPWIVGTLKFDARKLPLKMRKCGHQLVRRRRKVLSRIALTPKIRRYIIIMIICIMSSRSCHHISTSRSTRWQVSTLSSTSIECLGGEV